MPLPFPRRANPQTKPGQANNRTVAHLRASRAGFVPGALIDVTTKGTFVRPRIQQAGPSEGGANVRLLMVYDIGVDYLVCRTFSGSTIGATDILVALPYKLRRTPFHNQSIVMHVENPSSNPTVSYVYNSNTRRAATTLGQTEQQIIVPRYRAIAQMPSGNLGDHIFAVDVDQSGVVNPSDLTPITLLDLNVDGRAWSRE